MFLAGLLPPKFQLSGDRTVTDLVLGGICYLLLAHCFYAGSVMLKSAGVADCTPLFDIMTHFLSGECHLVSLPPFFDVLELATSLLSINQKVETSQAPEWGTGGQLGFLVPSFSAFVL